VTAPVPGWPSQTPALTDSVGPGISARRWLLAAALGGVAAEGALVAVNVATLRLRVAMPRVAGCERPGSSGGMSRCFPRSGSLVVRLVLAAALIAWGARTDRRWTVPVEATLALPLLWPANWAMLVGVLPTLRQGLARRFES